MLLSFCKIDKESTKTNFFYNHYIKLYIKLSTVQTKLLQLEGVQNALIKYMFINKGLLAND